MVEICKFLKSAPAVKIPGIPAKIFWETASSNFVGYQVNFSSLELGYLLFNHLTCQSTIAVPAGLFKDLYDGPVFSERKTDSDQCPGYCNDREALDVCGAECECAYVREIMQIVREWPKGDCRPAKVAQGGC